MNTEKKNLKKKSRDHHVIRKVQEGSGKVRLFSKTSQGHGLGKVRLQETENNSVNRNLFLIKQPNSSCLQNGARNVPHSPLDLYFSVKSLIERCLNNIIKQ